MLISIKKLSPERHTNSKKNGWIALDPKTGATLRRSPEVFPSGSQIKYYLYIPNLMVRVIWAKTDKEAMAIANNGSK
jgi:hypothetical protein